MKANGTNNGEFLYLFYFYSFCFNVVAYLLWRLGCRLDRLRRLLDGYGVYVDRVLYIYSVSLSFSIALYNARELKNVVSVKERCYT